MGAVKLKDTPRKVVWYRTAAQMVGFESLAQNCKNHFMDCGVMIAAMGGPGKS